MTAHLTESRYCIDGDHIGGLFHAGFVGTGKWFRWVCPIRRILLSETHKATQAEYDRLAALCLSGSLSRRPCARKLVLHTDRCSRYLMARAFLRGTLYDAHAGHYRRLQRRTHDV